MFYAPSTNYRPLKPEERGNEGGDVYEDKDQDRKYERHIRYFSKTGAKDEQE
jgi:hypothetical protein